MSTRARSSVARVAAALLLAGGLAAAAEAKVVFTGYADFRATGQGEFRVDGPPSVLAGLGLGPERLETRGATIDALGLFAATSLSEQTRLLMDVTYRDIAGQNTRTIRVQYAYLEHELAGAELRLGKVTLPFGYYNQKRFYPFQRASITAPLFQSTILGLPLADLGATAGKTFEAGELAIRTDVYTVNGFGAVPGSTTSLRDASLPGGLTVANNVGSANANHRLAVGGRVDAAPRDLEDCSLGASYYRGEWGPAANLLQLANAHLHAAAGGFDFLAEYLFISAKGDQGLARNFGSTDWRTDGAFATLEYERLRAGGKKVTPWIRFEDYATRAYGTASDHEALWEAAGGAAVQLSDNLLAKAEADALSYRLPYVGLGSLTLRGFLLQAGLTVTF